MTRMTTSLHPDTRPLFATSVETATAVVRGVQTSHLDLATPCADFNVRALLGHMVMVLRRVSAVGRALDPMSIAEDVATDVGDSQWSAAWSAAASDAAEAWADGSQLAATIVFPWVSHSGADTLVMYAAELSTHTWDLAVATGQTVDWNDEVLDASIASVKRILPEPKRASLFEAVRDQMPPEYRDFPPPFADAVDVPAYASRIDRLIAWQGRKPHLKN
jgi:uncharacterized protein (TIGR03086 family)